MKFIIIILNLSIIIVSSELLKKPLKNNNLESLEDSGSIEIPIRRATKSGKNPNRPILELVLGVLDTFHSSARADLRRIRARRDKQSSIDFTKLQFISTTTTTTTAMPIIMAKPTQNVLKTKKFLIVM